MRFILYSVSLILSSTLLGCSSKKKVESLHDSRHVTQSRSVTLMTFNVENLFDTEDDPQKNDDTFLPLGSKKKIKHQLACKKINRQSWQDQCLNWDWSEENLKIKFERLAAVVKQVNKGLGPDVLFLQEVENIEVLKRWNQEYLADLGYSEVILIEGHDKRGIDVAFLSRLPLASQPQLLPIPFTNISRQQNQDTRGILKAQFKLLDGTLFTAFSAHFPAPFHPAEMRIQAFEFLNKQLASLGPAELAVAAGDFNVPADENAKLAMLQKHVAPHWIVAHQQFCRHCRGTTYYPPKELWSFLDMILLSKSFEKENAPWSIDTSSMEVVNAAPYQKNFEGFPVPFDLPGPQGVSDHWPLIIKIVKR